MKMLLGIVVGLLLVLGFGSCSPTTPLPSKSEASTRPERQPGTQAEVNPIPKRKRHVPWDLEPMSPQRAVLPYTQQFSEEQMTKIRKGLEPRAMEDHWWMIFEDNHLYIRRSYTGICIYQIEVAKVGDHYEVVRAEANRDPEFAPYWDEKQDLKELSRLVDWLIQ
jgi:hypothetical protein